MNSLPSSDLVEELSEIVVSDDALYFGPCDPNPPSPPPHPIEISDSTLVRSSFGTTDWKTFLAASNAALIGKKRE